MGVTQYLKIGLIRFFALIGKKPISIYRNANGKCFADIGERKWLLPIIPNEKSRKKTE